MIIAARFFIFHLARWIVKLRYHDFIIITTKFKFLFNKKSSIISIEEGVVRHENGKYAMLLIYQPDKISWYVKNAIVSLNEAKINTVVIVNHNVNDDQRSYLKQNSKILMIRNNSGFDIGAFKDSTTYLKSIEKNIERLIYMNDSVYFFKSGLTELLKRLADSESDICAPFENWEIHYHIQSFCFSVSGRVFRNEMFQKFWESYLPVNSRLWAINKGEVGLSRAMIPLAESIDIVYRPNNLRENLSKIQDIDSRMKLTRLLPIPLRDQNSEISSLTDSEVVQFFISKIGSRSQIHTGGFLYRKYNRNPLIKRDLVYRDQYTIDEIEVALMEIDHEGHFDELMTDFRKKGKASQLPIIKRLQAASGII